MVSLALKKATATNRGKYETLVEWRPDFDVEVRHCLGQKRTQLKGTGLEFPVRCRKPSADLSVIVKSISHLTLLGVFAMSPTTCSFKVMGQSPRIVII